MITLTGLWLTKIEISSSYVTVWLRGSLENSFPLFVQLIPHIPHGILNHMIPISHEENKISDQPICEHLLLSFITAMQHFEDFVAGHFRTNARRILLACKAYTEGAAIGSLGNNVQVESSQSFKEAVAKMMNSLVSIFARNGSKDCEEFRHSG